MLMSFNDAPTSPAQHVAYNEHFTEFFRGSDCSSHNESLYITFSHF